MGLKSFNHGKRKEMGIRLCVLQIEVERLVVSLSGTHLVHHVANGVVVRSLSSRFPAILLHQTDDDLTDSVLVSIVRFRQGDAVLWVGPE